jgi:hypothetical protein
VGYFTDQPVVNLDGVVNSYDFRDARRHGRTDEFLRDEDVSWLVNHAGMVNGQDPNIGRQADALLGEGTGDGLVLEQSWPFVFSGQIEGQAANVSGGRQMAVFLYRLPPDDG